MRKKTLITKLLQCATEVYYKVRQVLQSATGITKCDRLLLQSASDIMKCDSYYKVRRNICMLDVFKLTIGYFVQKLSDENCMKCVL